MNNNRSWNLEIRKHKREFLLYSPVDQVSEALLDHDADLGHAPSHQDVAHVPRVSHLGPQVPVHHATGIIV